MTRIAVVVCAVSVLVVLSAGAVAAEPEPPMAGMHEGGMMHQDLSPGMMRDGMMQHRGMMHQGHDCGMTGQRHDCGMMQQRSGMRGMGRMAMNTPCGMGMGMRGMGMMRGPMGDFGMGRGGMKGDGHRQFMRRLWSLDLDEKQVSALTSIHNRVMRDLIRKKADIGIARIDLSELLARDPIDMAASEAKIRQIQNIRADTLLTLIKAKEEAKALLTPEQMEKMKENKPCCMDCAMSHNDTDFLGDDPDNPEGESEEQ